MGYKPAGRHLESSNLNPFEVRVSCRGIGQRVWRAEKTLLLLPILPEPARGNFQLLAARERHRLCWQWDRAGASPPPACPGLGKDTAVTCQWSIGIEIWTDRKSKRDFIDKKPLLIFNFIFLHYFYFPSFFILSLH